MEGTKLKSLGSCSDTTTKAKIDLKGSQAATPGGKGEKRDATSPHIPPKPQLEKKTRDTPGDTSETQDEATMDENEASPAYVFSKPMHPNNDVTFVHDQCLIAIVYRFAEYP